MTELWFCVLTLEQPTSRGEITGTRAEVLELAPGTTRQQVYDHMRGLFPPEFSHPTTIHFSVERDQLPIGGSPAAMNHQNIAPGA
ncbi:hypothetical protein [Actinomadura violacea]|uniref:MoaD/ThiS family protein n=1 Tax=Actinomadura violacea TaxID=2819934 RepID=A0ABS3RYC9_9ACTN|nr:hypothetical protein [Actinomadura violacea]MBO2461745.1 hypothetical protein [Actinomadura violacea]